jgi:hypothetical protein
MSARNWRQGDKSGKSDRFDKSGRSDKSGTDDDDGTWKTIGKKKSKSPSKGRKNTRNNTRGNNGNNGNRNNGNRNNGNRNNYRRKPDTPNIPMLIKAISAGVLGNHVKEIGLPSVAELTDIIAKIFEDVQTPDDQNRRVTRVERDYRRNLKFTNYEGMIKATLLNSILPEMMHYGVSNPTFDLQTYVADVLLSLIHSVEESLAKAANGFHCVNQLFWDKRLRDMISDGLESTSDLGQLYIQKQIEIIEVLKKVGISRAGLNKNREDWLLSYFEGIKAGRTLFNKKLVATLSEDLDTEKLVRVLINKISPKMSQAMVRKFKYALCMDMDGLTNGLMINVLGSYVFAKKRGVHERATSFLEMSLNFLKVGESEFDDESDVLCMWLKENYEYGPGPVRAFLTSLVNQAMILLSEKEARGQQIFSAQWAWDVIGSLIGEISVILGEPSIFQEFFDSQMHAVSPGSDSENQVLTLIAHVILRLKKKEPKASVERKKELLLAYLSRSICFNLSRLEFGSRTRMLIEDQISEFLAPQRATREQIRMIKLQDIGSILHSDRMIEYIEVQSVIERAEAEATLEDEANDRVTMAIECNYSYAARVGLSPNAAEIPGTDYPVFMGWRPMCQAMAKGEGEWPPIQNADASVLYQMIGNIAYYVGSELHPSDEKAHLRDCQIAALVKVLKAHGDLTKMQVALQAFSDDLSLLDDETIEYLWDNRRGMKNFRDFSDALGVKTIFT